MSKKVYEYKFGEDFNSRGGALTLYYSEVFDDTISGVSYSSGQLYTRTHTDGWTITGSISIDYYSWVNDFEAIHPTLGRVWGNFEGTVYAEKRKGFEDFFKKHQPEPWDYMDI